MRALDGLAELDLPLDPPGGTDATSGYLRRARDIGHDFGVTGQWCKHCGRSRHEVLREDGPWICDGHVLRHEHRIRDRLYILALLAAIAVSLLLLEVL